MLAEKPNVLVIEGLSEIGLSLIGYILENDLSLNVMVVGLKLPQLSFLTDAQLKAFEDPRVRFKQVNIFNSGECLSLCFEPFFLSNLFNQRKTRKK